MTRAKVKEILEAIGLPYAYHHFEVGKAPALPMMVFNYPQSDNFSADDTVYVKIENINIVLYTAFKDFAAENKIEAILEQYGLFYNKSEVYIESERAYQITYEMEELIDG